MVTEEKLKSGVPEPLNSGRVEMYYHSVADCFGAGSNRSIPPLNLHETKAA
jgi:hypothetical protein